MLTPVPNIPNSDPYDGAKSGDCLVAVAVIVDDN
jgi:hypothetical protein